MCKYQSMKFLHIISGCPQGRGNGTFLIFAMLLYNKKGTAFPCFMEKAVPYKKEKHLTKYQVLSSACAIGGGDKRDRTADLLNAIQALSQLSYTPIFCFRSPPSPDDFCIIAHNRKMSSSFFDFFHFLF